MLQWKQHRDTLRAVGMEQVNQSRQLGLQIFPLPAQTPGIDLDQRQTDLIAGGGRPAQPVVIERPLQLLQRRHLQQYRDHGAQHGSDLPYPLPRQPVPEGMHDVSELP